ncbi:hypothetical protein LINPERHAP2_LOCUS10952 [Linum perenne]
MVAGGFRLGAAWRVQHGAEIGRVVSSFCQSHQTDSDDFLSPSLQIGAEIGRVVSSFCRSHHLAPEGEGSLPCDGFNHVFDLVKKGNKAFRDNSFEEQAIHLLASICVTYNLDFQLEKR